MKLHLELNILYKFKNTKPKSTPFICLQFIHYTFSFHFLFSSTPQNMKIKYAVETVLNLLLFVSGSLKKNNNQLQI